MTDEAKRLIKAMRTRCAEQSDCNNCPKWDYCIVDGDHVMRNKAADLIESLAAELEQVKRERDAAIEDLETMGEYRPYCDVCLYKDSDATNEPCRSCCEGYLVSNWQWRGVKGDNE